MYVSAASSLLVETYMSTAERKPLGAENRKKWCCWILKKYQSSTRALRFSANMPDSRAHTTPSQDCSHSFIICSHQLIATFSHMQGYWCKMVCGICLHCFLILMRKDLHDKWKHKLKYPGSKDVLAWALPSTNSRMQAIGTQKPDDSWATIILS